MSQLSQHLHIKIIKDSKELSPKYPLPPVHESNQQCRVSYNREEGLLNFDQTKDERSIGYNVQLLHTPEGVRDNKEHFSLCSFALLVQDVQDQPKKYLIIRRNKNLKTLPGCLALPGGFVEKNETIVDGLLREIKEETGINIYLSQKWFHPWSYIVESVPPRSDSVNLMFIFVINVQEEIKPDLSSESARNETDSCFLWTIEELRSELDNPSDPKTTIPPGMKKALLKYLSDSPVSKQ